MAGTPPKAGSPGGDRQDRRIKPTMDLGIPSGDPLARPGDSLHDVSVAELESVRTLLRGSSIVDSERMHFQSRAEVEHFLLLLCYDVHRPRDRKRLLDIFHDAIEHLEAEEGCTIPEDLKHCDDPVLPFLWASTPGPLHRAALMAMKVAHVINHLEARRLRYMLPVSDSELFALAAERITAFGKRLRDAGVGVASLHASEKSRPSMIMKLLAKRETTAAQIHDRSRFRIIVKRSADILPTLLLMTRHLLPSNYVVPDESRNDLVPFESMLEWMVRAYPDTPAYGEVLGRYKARSTALRPNEFSHPDFRMINFVIDLPIRVDRFAGRSHTQALEDYGRVVFLLLEFQIYDLDNFQQNELGPSSHAHYKARQRRAVLRRLVGAEAVDAWRLPRV